MTIEGRVVHVLPLEQGISKSSGNPWSKATVIIETPGQYPKKVALTNMKNAEEFARLPIGTYAKFSIDVESREYNGRWYNEIRCYAHEIQGAQAQAQAPIPPTQMQPQYQQPQYQQPYAPPVQPQQADGDSIPF